MIGQLNLINLNISKNSLKKIWRSGNHYRVLIFFKQNLKKKSKLVLKEYLQKVLIAIIQTIVTFETCCTVVTCYQTLNLQNTCLFMISLTLFYFVVHFEFYYYVYCMLSLLPLRNGAHSMKKTVLTLNFSFLPTPDQVGKVCLAMNAPSSGTSPHPTQLQWNDQ